MPVIRESSSRIVNDEKLPVQPIPPNSITSVIIFDVGGVLTPDIRKPMLRALLAERYSAHDLTAILEATKRPWQQFCCDSTFTETAFWQAMIAATGLDETVETLQGRLRAWIRIYPETVAVARCLHRLGYILGLLTNHARPWFEEVMNRFDLWSLFTPALTVTSFECGLMKPNTAIYEVLWNRIHTCYPSLQHDHCIVIDDKLPNIQAAERLGMTAIHFHAERMPVAYLEQQLRERQWQ
jgi:HAD superfamily hydrolase (TIGR01509 family)